jgi:hypothetical protein
MWRRRAATLQRQACKRSLLAETEKRRSLRSRVAGSPPTNRGGGGVRIYYGKPRSRMGYVLEKWKREGESNHWRRGLSDDAHLEVRGIWGFSIGRWFFGVQRVMDPHNTAGE